jgi:hypothetical protein
MAVDFGEVLSHLFLGWHFQFQSEGELARIPSGEYIELSDTVPDFGFKLILMSGIDSETHTDLSHNTESKFNRTAVALQLSEAKLALDAISNKVTSGAYARESPVVMAIDFQHVLNTICLAWHFKYMTDEELAKLPNKEFERLGNIVPNFGFNLKIMAGIEPKLPTNRSEYL